MRGGRHDATQHATLWRCGICGRAQPADQADKPAGEDPTPAIANRGLSAQINAMLCVSRFAHYIKIMGREMTGSSLTAAEIERRLQIWLSGLHQCQP